MEARRRGRNASETRLRIVIGLPCACSQIRASRGLPPVHEPNGRFSANGLVGLGCTSGWCGKQAGTPDGTGLVKRSAGLGKIDVAAVGPDQPDGRVFLASVRTI